MARGVNADQFGKIIVNWAQKQVPEEANKRLRAVTLQLFRMIVLASPVDKGRFRSNWNLAVGGYPSGDPSIEAGEGAAAAHAIANGMRALDTMKTGIPSFIGIGNSMPYGPRLEYEPGFTTKAEAGFVRAAVAAVESWLRAGAP